MKVSKELKRQILHYGILQFELNDKGGPTGNGELFNKIIEMQDDILAQFGLPSTQTNQELLYYVDFPSTEELFFKIETLIETAKVYNEREPVSTKVFLKLAKENNDSAFNVLPELGICTSGYAMYVYDQKFLIDNCPISDIIDELEKCKKYDGSGLEIAHKFAYEMDKITLEDQNTIASMELRYLIEYADSLKSARMEKKFYNANMQNVVNMLAYWEFQIHGIVLGLCKTSNLGYEINIKDNVKYEITDFVINENASIENQKLIIDLNQNLNVFLNKIENNIINELPF